MSDASQPGHISAHEQKPISILIQDGIIAGRQFLSWTLPKLETQIRPFVPALVSVLFFLAIIATVFASFVAYALVFLFFMATFLLLLAWLLIKLGTAIATIVVFTLTIRTISETWPSAYQGTNFVDISDNTLKALHHNYQQLHSQIRALFSKRGLLLRGRFSTETSAPPQPEPTSHDHVSWWSLFTDLTSTIIEIDLVACRAILGVFATIVSSMWSTSSSFLGLPDSHRDIGLNTVIEPSGASSSVSL